MTEMSNVAKKDRCEPVVVIIGFGNHISCSDRIGMPVAHSDTAAGCFNHRYIVLRISGSKRIGNGDRQMFRKSSDCSPSR